MTIETRLTLRMISRHIKLGSGLSLDLRIPADATIADCQSPRHGSLDDAMTATTAALTDPLEFPPLANATFPGDRVALAVEDGVPQSELIVDGVVRTLLEIGTQPERISIVVSGSDAHGLCERLMARLDEDRLKLQRHDPTDRSTLAYLAASRDGRAIYVNRVLSDADFLIPIGCIRPEGSLGYLGPSAGLYPTFSDESTQRRFHAPDAIHSQTQHQRRRQESDEAAWLLGGYFTVQAIPGSGDSVLHVLAGEKETVTRRGQVLARKAWNCAVPRRSRVVLAVIEGGETEQSWPNVARSLCAAERIVEDDGVIVVCSDLRAAPGPSLLHFAESHSLDVAEHRISKERTHDALAAWQLARTLRRARVYLLSGLRDETVEQLGIGHVSHSDEITKLVGQTASCTLLRNSQHAVPVLEEELVGP